MITMSCIGVLESVGPSVFAPRLQLFRTVSFNTSMRVRPKSPPAHMVPASLP